MRPGREAPENCAVRLEHGAAGVASMRPGREAPENVECLLPAVGAARFNEAGARGPGKRPAPSTSPPSSRRFNEAGARGPGKPRCLLNASGMQSAMALRALSNARTSMHPSDLGFGSNGNKNACADNRLAIARAGPAAQRQRSARSLAAGAMHAGAAFTRSRATAPPVRTSCQCSTRAASRSRPARCRASAGDPRRG